MFANIIVNTCGAKHRTREAISHSIFFRNDPQPFQPIHKNPVSSEQLVYFGQNISDPFKHFACLGFESLREVSAYASDTSIRNGETSAGYIFNQLPEIFSCLDHIEE